jgi:predicted amidohydrolase
MDKFRIALANLRCPATPEESVDLARQAIARASSAGAGIVCFPECYVPGYRMPGRGLPGPGPAFLERAWAAVADAARDASVAVILGTERMAGPSRLLTALVIDDHGHVLGFQDKTQLDPSEEPAYAAGCGRSVFRSGRLTFGVVICHEGWRYPETVRFAARRGAQIVFHPHFHAAEPGGYRPSTFGDPANTFHERAILCRAAENTCFFASVNCASPGSPTTSAVADPDGALVAWQGYGIEGLLTADLDLGKATCLLARRFRPDQLTERDPELR